MNGARHTVVYDYWLDLDSETALRIQIKVLWLDCAYFSKIVDDRKSWFTWLEVFDVIQH